MKRALLALAVLTLSCTDCGGVSPGPSGAGSSAAPGPSSSGAAAQQAPANTGLTAKAVDERIRAEWKKEGVEPAPAVSDARFLRRVYLDIAGVIPPAEKVAAFLADTSPDKRARAVDELLASPRYADHFTDFWDRILMGRMGKENVVDRAAFRAWLHEQFEKNAPYTKLVAELITATGQNSEGKGAAPMPANAKNANGEPAMASGGAMAGGGAMAMEEGEDEETTKGAPVNGAVNWLLKYRTTPADLSGAVSRVFLGVQIQCAQCHDHKTEKWKMDDFKGFTASFLNTRVKQVDPPNTKGFRRVALEDLEGRAKKPKRKEMREFAGAKPTALDGTDLSQSPNPRRALADWMTAPQNPWFAQAIVNRMWAHFVGRGFIEPIDDVRPGNPAVMPELLRDIAKDFAAGGHDLKKLIRLITATEVYQRAAAPTGSKEPEKREPAAKLWARFRVEPMGTDELFESIVAATKMEPVLDKAFGESVDAIKAKVESRVTFLFDVDEEPAGQDEFNGTIPQALFLLNGILVGGGTTTIPGGALKEVLALPGGDEAKIRSLYLRTLSREPTAEESARWVAFVSAPAEEDAGADTNPEGKGKGKKKAPKVKKGADPLLKLGRAITPAEDARGQAYEDLFWALLNSSEFVLNH